MCKKETVLQTNYTEEYTGDTINTQNPFDLITYPAPEELPIPDSSTLLGLHVQLFLPRCAVPGCHDGNFEPDFRTVHSTYSTMVYHPIIKNNAAEDFSFRVIPYDTAGSVLHERITNCCFVDINDRMPQDNIGEPLEPQHIQHLSQWILDGAKDLNGNVATQTNIPALILPYFAAINDTNNAIQYQGLENRLDSSIFNPFHFPLGVGINFAFLVIDDQTLPGSFQQNELKVSTDPNDFSTAVSFPATYIFATGDTAIYVANIQSSDLSQNIEYYLRYYTSDGEQTNLSEFPHAAAEEYWKTFWSFKIY